MLTISLAHSTAMSHNAGESYRRCTILGSQDIQGYTIFLGNAECRDAKRNSALRYASSLGWTYGWANLEEWAACRRSLRIPWPQTSRINYLEGGDKTQNNDTHQNDIQHNETPHKGCDDIQHNDTQDNDIQHNNKWNATLSIMALNKERCYAECRLCWVSQASSLC